MECLTKDGSLESSINFSIVEYNLNRHSSRYVFAVRMIFSAIHVKTVIHRSKRIVRKKGNDACHL